MKAATLVRRLGYAVGSPQKRWARAVGWLPPQLGRCACGRSTIAGRCDWCRFTGTLIVRALRPEFDAGVPVWAMVWLDVQAETSPSPHDTRESFPRLTERVLELVPGVVLEGMGLRRSPLRVDPR